MNQLATIYPIRGPWKGRLAIVARPRGGDWLEDEVEAWRAAGLDVVVSLLEQDEAHELGLEDEAKACAARGLKFIEFPITDRGVPASLQRRSNSSQVLKRQSWPDKASAFIVARVLAAPR